MVELESDCRRSLPSPPSLITYTAPLLSGLLQSQGLPRKLIGEFQLCASVELRWRLWRESLRPATAHCRVLHTVQSTEVEKHWDERYLREVKGREEYCNPQHPTPQTWCTTVSYLRQSNSSSPLRCSTSSSSLPLLCSSPPVLQSVLRLSRHVHCYNPRMSPV